MPMPQPQRLGRFGLTLAFLLGTGGCAEDVGKVEMTDVGEVAEVEVEMDAGSTLEIWADLVYTYNQTVAGVCMTMEFEILREGEVVHQMSCDVDERLNPCWGGTVSTGGYRSYQTCFVNGCTMKIDETGAYVVRGRLENPCGWAVEEHGFHVFRRG